MDYGLRLRLRRGAEEKAHGAEDSASWCQGERDGGFAPGRDRAIVVGTCLSKV